METLFALVLVVSTGATDWAELPMKKNMTFDECDAAQHEIWAQDWPIVAVDEHGMIPAVDAYCVSMEALPLFITGSLAIPTCEFEDSNNCFWNASERGNGEGVSFLAWSDHVFYMN